MKTADLKMLVRCKSCGLPNEQKLKADDLILVTGLSSEVECTWCNCVSTYNATDFYMKLPS